MSHAQQAALALQEAGALEAFVTTFAFRQDRPLARALRRIPVIGAKAHRELSRRSMPDVAADKVRTIPGWELLRTAAQKAGAGPVLVDQIWDVGSHRFDALVADRHVPHTEAVQAFEYTALATFQRAEKEGVARILHLPSLENGHYAQIEAAERQEWSELRSPHDAYFKAKFAQRQARREAEIALADVIVCNSSLTAQSHIAAGAETQRIITIPLAAPPAIDQVRLSPDQITRPLRVISAGAFSLRKGAHHLLEAWRRLDARSHARLEVYGRIELPQRALEGPLDGVSFQGSVSQSQLLQAFETGDVLILPTLSDGFGLVVAEALSRGLPVITTDQAGAADLLSPDTGIIIPAGDPQAIVEALRWCLDNRSRLAEMRCAALASAKRRQWSDYRSDFIDALSVALRDRGYAPTFKPRA